ncbi:MAG TPA: DUF4350 domain-containing protein [Coleofasciculaceae cyanobacterium]
MNLSKRKLWVFGAIAIGALVLITVLAAPANDKLTSGSTYNRAPEGYGAWYAFMEKRGTPIERWRKPFEDLAKSEDIKPPATLLRVNSKIASNFPDAQEQTWIEKGNTLVILGVRQPVTEAPFTTLQQADVGSVKIDTTRRNKSANVTKQRLGDRFGAVVWEEKIGKGQVIYAATPNLAANAYQDSQGNYEFLAQLVTNSGVRSQESGAFLIQNQKYSIQNQVWVDEYIHGYKDSEVIKREKKQDIFSYFAQTPVFPAVVQGLILLLVAIWAGTRRFGKPVTLSAPVVNNSEAYIQALAGVLQKADSSEFVADVVGKEEQLQLQKALFLGQESLDSKTLIDAWVKQTGRPAAELEQVLQMRSQKRRMSETELLTWLEKWEQIRRYLPS